MNRMNLDYRRAYVWYYYPRGRPYLYIVPKTRCRSTSRRVKYGILGYLEYRLQLALR